MIYACLGSVLQFYNNYIIFSVILPREEYGEVYTKRAMHCVTITVKKNTVDWWFPIRVPRNPRVPFTILRGAAS